MKHYYYNGREYSSLPDPFDTGEFTISPMDEQTFIKYGGEITDDGQLTNFQICCAEFRDVCFQIQVFIHDPTFRGGFNEMHKLAKSPYALADPTTANTLSNLWNGTNLAATYEAKKIGLGQPDWWKACWKEYDDAQAKLQEELNKQQNPYDDINPYDDEDINPYDDFNPYEDEWNPYEDINPYNEFDPYDDYNPYEDV